MATDLQLALKAQIEFPPPHRSRLRRVAGQLEPRVRPPGRVHAAPAAPRHRRDRGRGDPGHRSRPDRGPVRQGRWRAQVAEGSTLDESEVGVPLMLSRAGGGAKLPYTVEPSPTAGRLPGRTYGPGASCATARPRPAAIARQPWIGSCPASPATPPTWQRLWSRTRRCCFCNTALTDARSISVGSSRDVAKTGRCPTRARRQYKAAAAELPLLEQAAA